MAKHDWILVEENRPIEYSPLLSLSEEQAAAMRRFLVTHGAILGAALLLTWRLANPEIWPQTQDGLRYHYLLEQFTGVFNHGHFYPRFLPNAFGGYGYPTFLFYQPGIFFLALPFDLLLRNASFSLYLSVLLLFYAGGVGVFKTCRLIASQRTALFCALLFLITPYVHVNLFVRNDLSELMAMLLCPWTLYWMNKLHASSVKRSGYAVSLIGLGVSIALVIYSHPHTAYFLVPSLCLFGFYLSLGENSGRPFLVRLATAILLGLLVSLPYWFTAFQLKPYVAYRDAIEGYFSFQRHFVYFFQFFSRTWGFGWSVKGPSDTMSFQLGLPHFVLATLGVMSWRRNRQMQALYGIYLILMVLMTSVSEPLWTLLPGMDYIQFPWRILSVIATFQIICIAGVERLERRMSGWTVWPLIMVVSLLWYVQEFRPNPDGTHLVSVALDVHREQQHRNFFSYTGSDEFTPLSAQRLRALGPRGERGLLEGTLDRPVRESTGSTPYRITGVVPMGRRSEVIINQMYIPGWRVELNGSPVSVQTIEGNLASDGRMRLTVPSEETVIVAYYDGPPWWRLRTALNVLGIALILAVVIRDSRRGSSHAAPRLSEPATLI